MLYSVTSDSLASAHPQLGISLSENPPLTFVTETCPLNNSRLIFRHRARVYEERRPAKQTQTFISGLSRGICVCVCGNNKHTY